MACVVCGEWTLVLFDSGLCGSCEIERIARTMNPSVESHFSPWDFWQYEIAYDICKEAVERRNLKMEDNEMIWKIQRQAELKKLETLKEG